MEKKNNHSLSPVINNYGNKVTIIINNGHVSERKANTKKSKQTWLKALGKLIRSLFVNIIVLFLEIFAMMG